MKVSKLHMLPEQLTLWYQFVPDKILLFLLVLIIIIYIRSERKSSKNLPPGPTGVPFLGYLPFLGSEPYKTLLQLSKKYKSNIIGLRLGSKYTVILNDYKTTKEMLLHPAALARAPNLFDNLKELGFAARDGEPWKEQRRYCMHVTRDLGLGRTAWENHLQEEIQLFLKELASSKGQPTNVFHSMNRAISNNILYLLIGQSLQKEEDKMQLILDYANVALTYTGPSNCTTLVPSLRPFFERLNIAGYGLAAKVINNFRKLIRDEITKHKTSVFKEYSDFINLYLEKLNENVTKNVKHYFSEDLLEGNISALFLGGSETIYSSLGWLFYLMASKPEIQKRVQDELDEVLGIDEIPSYYERSKIPYTFAVLMESQRYTTIVPLSTTRSATADIKIQGYTIPKGAEIIPNTWAMHNDPEYWVKPEEFNPSRFLTEDSQLVKTVPSYLPFSLGKRDCPGQTIAWMEILAFFTSVLRNFTIKKPPGQEIKCEIVKGLVEHLKPQTFCFVQRKH